MITVLTIEKGCFALRLGDGDRAKGHGNRHVESRKQVTLFQNFSHKKVKKEVT